MGTFVDADTMRKQSAPFGFSNWVSLSQELWPSGRRPARGPPSAGDDR
jgi:hypothetical protein